MEKLPEKWCITTTKESAEIVKNYLINVLNYGGEDYDWTTGNHYCISGNYVNGWLSHVPERKQGYTELTFEQFKKFVLKETTSKEIINKQEMKYYKTRQLLNRDITLCVAVEGNKIKTGYSVRLLDDAENIERGKKVSLGRALKDKTNLTPDLTITESLKEKYILAAIAEKTFADLEQGKIIIKGIRDKTL